MQLQKTGCFPEPSFWELQSDNSLDPGCNMGFFPTAFLYILFSTKYNDFCRNILKETSCIKQQKTLSTQIWSYHIVWCYTF